MFPTTLSTSQEYAKCLDLACNAQPAAGGTNWKVYLLVAVCECALPPNASGAAL